MTYLLAVVTVFLIVSPLLLPRADVRGWRLMYCVLAAIGGAQLFRRFDEGTGPMGLAVAYLVVAAPAVVIAGQVYLHLLREQTESTAHSRYIRADPRGAH